MALWLRLGDTTNQYVVKVTGSGRLTLRNRRFLRLFTPHSLQSYIPRVQTSPTKDNLVSPLPYPLEPVAVQVHSNPGTSSLATHFNSPHVLDETPGGPLPVINGTPTLAGGPPTTPSGNPSPRRTSSSSEPQRLSFGNIDRDALVNDIPETHVEFVRRSSRTRKPREMYDASPGKYTAPSVVPDDA